MSTTKVQSDMVDIDGATTATIATGDKINFLDITDSLVKEDTVQGILDLAGGGFTLASEVATTSGTTVALTTSIPATATLIMVTFEGVSTDGANWEGTVQIGDSGGIETSGYLGGGAGVVDATMVQITTGFAFAINSDANDAMQGVMTLALKDNTNNTWCSQCITTSSGGSLEVATCGGSKSTSATMDRISINSAGTFDAGSVTVSYL